MLSEGGGEFFEDLCALRREGCRFDSVILLQHGMALSVGRTDRKVHSISTWCWVWFLGEGKRFFLFAGRFGIIECVSARHEQIA